MENKRNLTPVPFSIRILPSLIDFVIAILLSTLGATLIFLGVLNGNPSLNNEIDFQNEHIRATHLGKENNSSYTYYQSNEYFEKTDKGYLIIDALSYFYTCYMTGNVPDGELASLTINDEIKVGDQTYIQKDYYTVDWFNENVLGLPKQGEEASKDYYVYQKDVDDNDDYTIIGTVNPKYIEEVEVDSEATEAVNAPYEMLEFTYRAYNNAVGTLYKLKYMVDSSNKVARAQNLTLLLTRISVLTIFFVVVPLITKRGKTLGKLIFRLSLVNAADGSDAAKWKVIPRALLILLTPVTLYFIPNTYIQLIVVLVLVIGTMIVSFTNQKKMCLHDFIAQTYVADDREIRGGTTKVEETVTPLDEEEDNGMNITPDVTFEEDKKE